MNRWRVTFLVAVALLTSCATPLRQAMVDTPNSCYRLERVEEDRVYLTSGGQRICLQVIGHVPVELDPSIRRVPRPCSSVFSKDRARFLFTS